MDGVGISIQGVAAASAYLRKERVRIEREANRGIKQATLFMEGEVKKSIAGKRAEGPFFITTQRGKTKEGPGSVPNSVDTGRFMGSVKHSVKRGVGIVYTDVKYAKYLEYGTSKITPRYHFRNSATRNRKKIRNILAKHIGKQFRPSIHNFSSKRKPISSMSDVLNI